MYAFIVGYGDSVIEGCHDDGEPSGTAGRPVLAVLRGSGLGDAAVVVTRYFGGTKLGTGGLVRAYSEAARAVLEALPRVQKIERQQIDLTLPYACYASVRRLIEQFEGQVVEEQFGAEVRVRLSLPVEVLESFGHAVAECSAGQAAISGAQH